MKVLNKPSDNMGGLLAVYAIPYDVFTISGKTITFSATDNIYKLYCTPDTMGFEEKSANPKSGIHYTPTVWGFVPKLTDDLMLACDHLERRKYVVLFQDGNTEYKLAGTRDQPLRFSSSFASGKKTSDRAGAGFNFSGVVISRSVSVNYPF